MILVAVNISEKLKNKFAINFFSKEKYHNVNLQEEN